MTKHGEPEGGPEQRRRQFEGSRGLPEESPELPLDPDEDAEEADEAEKPKPGPAAEKESEEDESEGGCE